MRRAVFKSIDDVLGSAIASQYRQAAPVTDRVLKSTRLEDKIYAGLRDGDAAMDEAEALCSPKLSAFSSLARDVYQGFYSLSVRRNDESILSDTAKRFNSHILDDMMNGGDYPAIKSVCEGRQLPAYDAASEFISGVSDGLDDLLREAGDKGALNTLEKLARQEAALAQTLDALLQQREKQGPEPALDSRIVNKANAAAGKARQVEAVGARIQDNLLKNRDAVSGIVAQAAKSAKAAAEDTAQALAAWGRGDSESGTEQMALNRETVERVRHSPVLKEVARFLGRFREITAKARKNGYAYGRGETYSLELGDDLQNVLTSEFSMLAVPAAIPLFLRKYQNRELQQYRRRAPIFKGCGDIVMCLDESGSTREDAPWGKAVALALLDAAVTGGRKFALIHFSTAGRYKTDLFLPDRYDVNDVLVAAETFLGGNTDFETPLREACRLIGQEGFENADIVFTTDGVCRLPECFREELKLWQQTHKFSVTGILLDIRSPGMDFSLKPFCNEIFRTSELSRDSIVESLISERV
ncbi:MAG: hypothetical protein LBL15_02445 [Oscillospiraceae bacterium]|jgi:uncharacterized protein with von Willebrand factor type A (vWA) domain|nr:hypothetical protein [Oscillospiraceae bacterium]